MKIKMLGFLLLSFSLVLFSCGGDAKAPVISGAEDIVHTIGDDLPDLEAGITALDDIDGNLDGDLTFDITNVDFTAAGTYTVSVAVLDAAGNETKITFSVVVQHEQVAPVISGAVELEFEQGAIDPLLLANVVAIDNVDGDITANIVIDSSAIDFNVIGEYNLVYTVSDLAGNESSVTVSVFIRAETIDPIIEGTTNITVGLTEEVPNFLLDVTAIDNFDGDLTADVIVTGTDFIDFAVPGIYEITYSVSDAAGNVATVTVNVEVKDDIAPELNGTRNLTFEVHSSPVYVRPQIEALDNYDGDITDYVIADDSLVDTSTLGTYLLTYSVTDSAGNTTEITVEITIVDRTAPLISAPSIFHHLGDSAPDFLANVVAMDNYDGDLTVNISYDSLLVNLEAIGEYDLIYTVTDNQGNTGTLTVKVIVPDPLDVATVNDDIAALSLPTAPITSSLALPATGANGSTITWESAQPEVITSLGNVIRPNLFAPNAEVEMIATFKQANYESQATYTVVVAAITESNVTSQRTLTYTGLGTEYITSDSVLEAYYVDNGNLPFVNIEDFIMLLEGALVTEIINFEYNGNYLTISYITEYEDIHGNLITETLTAVLDFANNTFTIDTFNFFEHYIATTTSDFGHGLVYVDASFVDPHQIVFPLGDYGFDLIIHNDNGIDVYLMPFHVANLLFAGGVYFDVYYNGDKFFGVDTFQMMGRGDSEIRDLIRTSSLNARSVPHDVQLATYNFLALAFDFFYGLKEVSGVETYYDVLAEYIDAMVFGSDIAYYKSIFEFIYGLDDLHTSHTFAGYYEDPTDVAFNDNFKITSLSQLGTRTQRYYTRSWAIEDQYEDRFGSVANIPFSRVFDDGKTAVIYLDGFTIDTPTDFMRALEALPATVENVVIDLANNGGGNLGAVLRIFGYMTEETFMYHSQNPTDGSAATFYIESDYVAFDFNWYVMTSSVTFSAANLFASMAQELGIPVIGQNASGGASSIGFILPPGGSALLISTTNVLSARVVNELGEFEYLSIEFGITVDHRLESITDDAEIAALIDYIKSLG